MPLISFNKALAGKKRDVFSFFLVSENEGKLLIGIDCSILRVCGEADKAGWKYHGTRNDWIVCAPSEELEQRPASAAAQGEAKTSGSQGSGLGFRNSLQNGLSSGSNRRINNAPPSDA